MYSFHENNRRSLALKRVFRLLMDRTVSENKRELFRIFVKYRKYRGRWDLSDIIIMLPPISSLLFYIETTVIIIIIIIIIILLLIEDKG